MKNLLSYCGLVDAKIRASDKDLPVKTKFGMTNGKILKYQSRFGRFFGRVDKFLAASYLIHKSQKEKEVS